MQTTEQTLQLRSTTHGNYSTTARYAQDLKGCIGRGREDRVNQRQKGLTAEMIESLDMIASKIARILSGDPFEPDHWNDIAGYAKLTAISIERNNFIEEQLTDIYAPDLAPQGRTADEEQDTYIG